MALLSFRSKLTGLFASLGLLAVLVADWQASTGGTEALREATFERLAGIRETKRRQVERYFGDLANHVLALSADESSLQALEEWKTAWGEIPVLGESEELREFYRRTLGGDIGPWYPADGRVVRLQEALLARNPHPSGQREMLLRLEGLGRYSKTHERFHPTFHRYAVAFGFYDIFLIDHGTGRVLYTVRKEVDLGAELRGEPYRGTGLAQAFEKAVVVTELDQAVVADYSLYRPSMGTPAAFVAAPMWRGGRKQGVLAIQVSIDEVDRVMTGNRGWEQEGLGRTGQAYLVGKDGLLRSNLREHGEKTSVLTPRGADRKRMLRTQTPLGIAGLEWTLVAEMEEEEAYAPVQALRWRIYGAGSVVALLLMMPAWWMGRSVTNELMAKQEELQRLSGRLIQAQEEERSRLARELHDDLTQRLAAVAIEAGRWKKTGDVDHMQMALEQTQVSLGQISKDVQGLSRRLHSSVLDDLGLAAAIAAECRAVFERGGPVVEFAHAGEWNRLDDESRLTLYRIVQEALANAFKHAQATEVKVDLRQVGEKVKLEVADDGCGFTMGRAGQRMGLGLASMAERARLSGGQLEVESEPGKGTRIRVELPWREVKEGMA